MVVILIFAFLAGGVYAIFGAGENFWLINKTRVELHQELRKALDYMINDLRQAGSSSIIDVPADGTWRSSIRFKTPAGVSGGTLTWNLTEIQFLIGGTNADELRRVEGADVRVLAQNMQALQFRRLAATPNIIEISMQAQKETDKGFPVGYDLDFSIQLRN